MKLKAFVFTIASCALLCSCAPKQAKPLVIAEQFGTAYAPVALMRENGLLERRLNIPLEWKQLQNTAAIREAMLAGQVQIGFMAIPPFLIGLDNQMDWKIFTGLSSMPMGLTTRDDVDSIAGIPQTARIALPQPGSIQHILLAMTAERELGDAASFDNRLVSLSHPDGMSILLAGGDVSYHFTSAPYLGQELDAGMRLILSGEEAFGGEFTGIVGVAQSTFLENDAEVVNAFMDALNEAITLINENPEEAAEILAPVYGMTPAELLDEITGDNASYGTGVQGVRSFAEFMQRTGYIKEIRESDEMIFEVK